MLAADTITGVQYQKEIIAVLSAARRRLAVLASVLLLGLVATGCGDVREQTQWSGGRVQGVNADAGDIGIRNVVVVSDSESQQATVLAAFVNNGNQDELVSVRVGSTQAEPEGGSLTIPANAGATLGPDGTRLDVEGVDVQPGRTVELEFIFGSAPRATVGALVEPPEGIYADALN